MMMYGTPVATTDETATYLYCGVYHSKKRSGEALDWLLPKGELIGIPRRLPSLGCVFFHTKRVADLQCEKELCECDRWCKNYTICNSAYKKSIAEFLSKRFDIRIVYR